jgi:uncharacterized protein DUF4012
MRSGTRQGTAPTDPGAHRARARPARRHRRRAALTGSLLLGSAAAFVILSLAATVRHVEEDLASGRSAMQHGRDELFDGDAPAASEAFREGGQRFARAEARADGLLFRAVSWLPIVGRTADAVDVIAGSAVTASEAAAVLADAAAEIPGGVAGLAPIDGGVDLDRFPPLATAAQKADGLMTAAVSRLERAPTSLLLGPVGPARREAESELRELSDTIHTASMLLQGFPRFLGAEGPRRYFFGAQNPAELRGTGGLIGAYSILRIEHGRFHFTPFVPIHGLAQPSLRTVPAPNDDYAANYDQFRRDGRFWTAINVMPDFPSVAREILSAYEASTGEHLDGVILADPFAEAALLESAGPVELRGYGIEIDADNVVAFTTNEAYSLFGDPARRKRVLGDVARAAFARFVNQAEVDHADLSQLVEAAAGRHIQVFSDDATMQEGLRATPMGGALRPADAQEAFLSVVVNSAAGSKVDFYQERSIRYAVELHGDGSAAADFGLTLRNDAPSFGQPPYVIGPQEEDEGGPILRNLEAGESVALVNVYCGTDCIPREARVHGAPVALRTKVDLGVRYLQNYYPIRSGEKEVLRLLWNDPSGWVGNSSGGAYRMTFMNQTAIRPPTLSLRIEPPADMQIVSVSAPLRIVDGAAVYHGEPGSRLDVSVEFRPSLPLRLWRNVTRFLTTPVFEI